ncbi:MAG: amidohydrolase, partial [Bacteroidota bacterium]
MKLKLTFLALLATLQLIAQEKKDDKKWDISNPPGSGWNWKPVNFTTNEGTWMNLDVSPDGKSIVFDLLGDIYTIPLSGGKGVPLRTGIAWEVQPRFSPDGKKISFTSDAGGGDNIWVMKADGTDARQVTKEDFRLLNNAVWMPDGEYLVARKHFTSGRSLGAGEMWMYHLSGGEGLQLTERKNDQQDVNEPSVSPDGRYVYFSEDMSPGGFFQYNKDPNSQIYVIRRYDRQKGKVEDVITGPGGAFRPQVSNDGKLLAFLRRVRTETVLWVHNLETGEEYPLFDQLSKDQQEAWAIFGVYPGFDWMPQDNEIVIYGLGKIWRVPVMLGAEKPGRVVEIPFEVEVKQQVAETVRPRQKAWEETMDVKVIRHAVTSPDGKWLVFNAAGYLWVKELPNGYPMPFELKWIDNPNAFLKRPSRRDVSPDFEFEPSFSPDGSKIVFVKWNDEKMGSFGFYEMPDVKPQVDTSVYDPFADVEPDTNYFTLIKGIIRTPSFSPDGKWIVFKKEGGNSHQGYTHCKEPGI